LYLQFRDTCGKRRNINLILDVTPLKEITWGCIWRTEWQVVKTPKIISNNPVFFVPILSPSSQNLPFCSFLFREFLPVAGVHEPALYRNDGEHTTYPAD